ncbi:hypothetical protein [Phytobacter diazotrophicus]|uniref:hypothetical protein n=1 Tax=Phytobacter diazotrophicus TaxID=395631 RepID=UPI002FF682E6
MSTIASFESAQQRQFDRIQLQQIDEALATNDETRKRLEMMRREVINRLGLNKPDGPEVA